MDAKIYRRRRTGTLGEGGHDKRGARLHEEPDPTTTSIFDSCCLQMAIAPREGTLILGDEPVCLTVHDYYSNKTGRQEGHGVVGMPLDRQTFVLWRRGALGSRDKVSLFRLSRRGFKDINPLVSHRTSN